jgi:hypothetical protein
MPAYTDGTSLSMPAEDPLDAASFSFHAETFVHADRAPATSDAFTFLGSTFTLSVYPFGLGQPSEDGISRHVAVVLSVDKKLAVLASVSVIHPDESAAPLSRLASFTESRIGRDQSAPGKNCFGWPVFARLADLKRDGYVRREGSVVFAVKLILEEDAVSGRDLSSARPQASLLRMLDDTEKSLGDVRLQGNDSTGAVITAHRCVLSTFSDVFSNLLGSGFKESASDVVKFDDISSAGLRVCVRYLYGEELPLLIGDDILLLLDVWKFATVSLLTELAADCQEFVSGQIWDESFFEIFDLAALLDCEPVLKRLGLYLHEHMQRLAEEEDVDQPPAGGTNPPESKDGSQAREPLNLALAITEWPAEKVVTLLKELPPDLAGLQLAEAWIMKNEEERAPHGAAIFQALAIDELPTECLRFPGNYAVAAKYCSVDCLFRVLLKVTHVKK